jgi:hypothetical protein
MAKSWATSINRSRRAWRPWLAAAAVCCAVPAGCSDSPYELAQVTGAVSIDGRPFTHGKVMFAPIAKGESRLAGKAAFGQLGPDGTYRLSTYKEGDGAVAGDHWVTVIHIAPKGEGATAAEPEGGWPPFTRVAVPQKVTVSADQDNRIDIRLTRQDVDQYGVKDN